MLKKLQVRTGRQAPEPEPEETMTGPADATPEEPMSPTLRKVVRMEEKRDAKIDKLQEGRVSSRTERDTLMQIAELQRKIDELMQERLERLQGESVTVEQRGGEYEKEEEEEEAYLTQEEEEGGESGTAHVKQVAFHEGLDAKVEDSAAEEEVIEEEQGYATDGDEFDPTYVEGGGAGENAEEEDVTESGKGGKRPAKPLGAASSGEVWVFAAWDEEEGTYIAAHAPPDWLERSKYNKRCVTLVGGSLRVTTSKKTGKSYPSKILDMTLLDGLTPRNATRQYDEAIDSGDVEELYDQQGNNHVIALLEKWDARHA